MIRFLGQGRHSRRHLGSWVVVSLGIACGGTTESGNQPAGGHSGAAAGGASNGGGNTSGSAAGGSTAGRTQGGSSSAGVGGHVQGTSGSLGDGGSYILIAGAGNAGVGGSGGVVNALCPARQPMSTECPAGDASIACQYDLPTGCLCYMSPNTFAPCQKVDPTCPTAAGTAGASAGNAGAAGFGGFAAKIALPPVQICSCTPGSLWTCTLGVTPK